MSQCNKEHYSPFESRPSSGTCSIMSPGNTVCMAAVVAAICLAITIARRK